MNLKFDTHGNLPKDISLTPIEFEKHFGYNPKRKKLIKSLFEIAIKFAEVGCEIMYVNGSFVTNKKLPGDVDVAFDISEVDYIPAKQKYPELFTEQGQAGMYETLKLDVFTFGDYNKDILYIFGKDRRHNKKGIVKIYLKEFERYDKK
jgi:hypothetical protein